MARGGAGGGKRNAKQQTSTPSKSTTVTSSTATVSLFPPPFEALSPTSTLKPFLATLPTHHIYLIHPDLTPRSQKRSVFLLPILLNIVLTLLLAWRAYYAIPTYFSLLLATLGYETPWSVETAALGAGDLIGVISERTGYLMVDYAIFGLVGRWPWEFCFGIADTAPSESRRASNQRAGGARNKAGALTWRSTLGFQDRETVVRRSRRWDAALPLGDLGEAGEEERKRSGKPAKQWTREEELSAHVKIEAAMRTTYTSKTGYLLLDKDWDLDFRGMIDITQLIAEGKTKPGACDHVALLNVNGVWGAWYPHRSSNSEATEESGSAVEKPSSGTLADDAKLRVFKDKLAEMSCEPVFYRWIEMIQYETSRGLGHFNEKRKAEAVGELRKMIKDRGRDDRELWEAIGGLGGVPGLEDDNELQ